MDYKEKVIALLNSKDLPKEQKEKLEEIFPELKESEDEKIREDLIIYLRSILSNKKYGDKFIEDWIAWLEKQGEHANFLNKIQIGDKVTRNKDGVLVNLSQLNRVVKPADKVEPKFHKGEWISGYYTSYKVLSVNNDGYVVEDVDGNKINILFENEKFHHLWTIQDAKKGDVLSFDNEGSNYHSIGIFKRIASKNEPNGNTYRCYVRYGGFKGKLEIPINGDELHHCGTSAHPAVKEQCDILFQKMKEAGYEWDAEKKELKKIEHKPVWSEEDEKIYQSIMDDTVQENQLNDKQTNWLRGIKYRYFLQPKQEWSEEDETYLDHIITAVKLYYTDDKGKENPWRNELLRWLKSLKARYTWKPSEEQMNALQYTLEEYGFDSNKVLKRLLDELKTL